jgi:hypothetical protein
MLVYLSRNIGLRNDAAASASLVYHRETPDLVLFQ